MLITSRVTMHTLAANERLVFLTDELFKHSLVPAKEFEKIAKDGFDVSYVVRDGKKLVASFIYADLFLPVNETVYLICKKYGLEYCMWETLKEFPEKATFRPIYLCTEKQFHYFEEKKPKRATKRLKYSAGEIINLMRKGYEFNAEISKILINPHLEADPYYLEEHKDYKYEKDTFLKGNVQG